MQYNDADLEIHYSITDVPDEEQFNLHAHNRYEIYCFLSGQGYYTVEGHDYPLSPGCILVMRDGETHKLHISSDLPYERVALHFSPNLIPPTKRDMLLYAFRAHPLGQGNMLPPSDATARVKDMLLHITDPSLRLEGIRLRTLSYLPAILYELSREAMEHPNASLNADAKPLVGQIIDYINEDPSAVGGMEALEEKFGFSRSYLNRTFRSSTGVSIWDYVILKRLTLARHEILAGTPAATVAEQAGYTDYSSFYRQYKKRFGVTPEEDKRNQAKKNQS